MTGPRPVVATYRDTWLDPSEGFVIEPALHFQRYDALPVGLSLSAESHPLIDRDRVQTWGQPVGPDVLRGLRTRGFPDGFWRGKLGADVALVHAHFGPDALTARHVARDLGVPLVVSLHGYDVTMRDRDFLRDPVGRNYLRHRRRLRTDSQLFLSTSDYLRSQMPERHWPAARTVTHYLGVDTGFWTPTGTALGPDLLFVGRLVRLKGADTVIQAFHQLRADHPGTRLHVVGAGPERSVLEQAAAPAGARIVFHGSLGRAGIKQLMGHCRAVVLPSRQDKGRQEALNLVALEAAASGLPVVASTSGGLGEVVVHGQTGFLEAEERPDLFADRLRALLGDAALAHRLGRAGRARTTERFAIAAQAGRLEAHYDRVVDQHLHRLPTTVLPG